MEGGRGEGAGGERGKRKTTLDNVSDDGWEGKQHRGGGVQHRHVNTLWRFDERLLSR